MGANIGTTSVTSFIIGLNWGLMPFNYVSGTVLLFFTKNRINNISRILFGLENFLRFRAWVSAGMGPLKNCQKFSQYMITLGKNPILGVLAGAICFGSSWPPLVCIRVVLLSLVYPSLLAQFIVVLTDKCSDGANVSALLQQPRALLTWSVQSLYLILLTPFTAMIEYFQGLLHLSPEMTIAFSHGLSMWPIPSFNSPFIGALACWQKLIPSEDEVGKYEPLHLDENLITQAPSIALGNAKKELLLWWVCR